MSRTIQPREQRSAHYVEDPGFRLSEGPGQPAAERERAVMVRVWEQLRGAQLLPYGRSMTDRVPAAVQDRFQGLLDAGEINELPTTYEAAMRVLVTDQNSNRRLDVNLDALMRSGVVRQGVSRDAVRAALLSDPAGIDEDRTSRLDSSAMRS
ncbi:MAG: hypothetical protein AAFY60_11770, partial [Myxococcota bacterium]